MNKSNIIADDLLLPCPICGEKSQIIYCDEHCCGAEPRMVQCNSGSCELLVWVNGNTDEAAIKQWNTRYADKVLLDTLENLIEAITEATEEMKPIFLAAYIHGFEYKGRQYEKELEAAKKLLKKYKGSK